MMKHLFTICCSLLCLLSLAGCPPAKQAGQQENGASDGQSSAASSGAAVEPGTSFSLPLEIAADDEALTSLDFSDPRLWALSRCLALPLTQSQGDGGQTPGLASKWETSDDGTTWTFTLQTAPGHAGEPGYLGELLVTHFKTILHGPETPLRAQISDLIQGTADYGKGAAAEISGMQVADNTLVFTLTRPDNYFAAWISQPGLGVLENWEIGQATGYGAWRVASFNPANENETDPSQLILEPNPNSLVGQPVAAGLTFLLVPDRQQQVELFQAGRLQTANIKWEDSPSLEDDGAFRRLETAVPTVGQFDLHQFPWGESQFQSKLGLRQAINWAFDREYLSELLNGQITAWPYFFPQAYKDLIPPALIMQPTYPLGQDITSAQKGLAAADHMDGSHLIPGMDLGYLNNSDVDAEVVEVLRYWNEVSVKMRPFVMTPAEQRLRLDQGTHEIIYRRLFPAYPSPDALAYPYLYGTLLGNGGNYWNQAQPAIDEIIRKAQADNSLTSETRFYRELAGELDKQALLVFVGYYTPAVLISPSLGGYTLSPFDFSASLPMQDFTKLGLVE